MAIITLILVFSLCLSFYGFQLYRAQKSLTSKVKDSNNPIFYSEKITVLVAARNEEKTISSCLTSILSNKNNAPEFNIIVVNDHSTDKTAEIVRSFQHFSIQCMDLPDGICGKKQALEYGINLVSGGIILTTDADCIVQPDWVKYIVEEYKKEAQTVMTTGIVLPSKTDSLLYRFQWLDFAATMTLTCYGISKKLFYVSNGANMSFTKEAFQKVSGYRDNHHIASGDDVFLSKKLANLPNSTISFVRNLRAVVNTQPETSWRALWYQRKRWASKSKSYASTILIMFQGLVFLLAISLFILMGLGIFWEFIFFIPAIFIFIGKYIIDYIFLNKLSNHFAQKEAMNHFALSFVVYQFYIVMVGILALFPSKTKWKGRRV